MQRVIHRSGLFSRFLFVLWCLALLLLFYTLTRQNLPERLTHRWPWKLQLLDVQSAVAAVLATGGASLARAQYARTVRPTLGYFGRVYAGFAPHDQLAWVCHMLNGSQDVAVIVDIRYSIAYTSAAHAGGARDSSEWVQHQAAVALIESCGLVNREEFQLTLVGPGRPVSGPPLLMGWFTETAMGNLNNVFVRVRVLDRVGDTHERVINLLQGAIRSPSHPDPPPL
ncbi:hypothetical protein [Streptomyces sp. NPDC056660]|uniref:hypothetical protein n=1 Tax=Streptomyces sp. NPDC056660 TaxID=3345897 RepID=UPI00367C7032